MAHELNSYETGKAELMEETIWQRLAAGDFSVDPETYCLETVQVLDLGMAEPKWDLCTADDLRRENQRGTRVCGRNMVRDGMYGGAFLTRKTCRVDGI